MKISELFDLADKAMKISPQTAPPVMADRLVEINTYYAMLSDILSDAEIARDEAEEAYKVRKLESMVDLIATGNAVSKAEIGAENDATSERSTYVSARSKYKKLKSYQGTMERTVDTIIARLAWVKHEMRGNQALT